MFIGYLSLFGFLQKSVSHWAYSPLWKRGVGGDWSNNAPSIPLYALWVFF
jgi:hypothetical protein